MKENDNKIDTEELRKRLMGINNQKELLQYMEGEETLAGNTPILPVVKRNWTRL